MNVEMLLQLLDQLRIYHWQTTSFAQHKAFGEKYDSISGLVDSLVETYAGKHKRVMAGEDGFKIEVQDYDENCDKVVDIYVRFISGMDFDDEPDLDNIKADILIELNHLKYLLTLS